MSSSRYHAREGWWFQSEEDGSVVIEDNGRVVKLDPKTWASVVASVSARGEDAQMFGWAETLHGGGMLIRASVTHGPDPAPGGPLPDPFDRGANQPMTTKPIPYRRQPDSFARGVVLANACFLPVFAATIGFAGGGWTFLAGVLTVIWLVSLYMWFGIGGVDDH